MSKFLDSVAAVQFDSEVKQAYQTSGKLQKTVTTRDTQGAKTYNFRKIGKGKAINRSGPSVDVTPLDITHSLTPVVLKDYEAAEYTDIFNQSHVNFQEMAALSSVLANAIARAVDQDIISALAKSPASSKMIAATPDLTTLVEASERLNKVGVAQEGRFFICDEAMLSLFLNTDKITNVDYANVKALISGEINSFMGFNFVIINSARAEGGLGAGNAFAYHRSAIGNAFSLGVKTEVNYIPQKLSWLSTAMMSSNACLIDPEGVVKISKT